MCVTATSGPSQVLRTCMFSAPATRILQHPSSSVGLFHATALVAARLVRRSKGPPMRNRACIVASLALLFGRSAVSCMCRDGATCQRGRRRGAAAGTTATTIVTNYSD